MESKKNILYNEQSKGAGYERSGSGAGKEKGRGGGGKGVKGEGEREGKGTASQVLSATFPPSSHQKDGPNIRYLFFIKLPFRLPKFRKNIMEYTTLLFTAGKKVIIGFQKKVYILRVYWKALLNTLVTVLRSFCSSCS